jgi:hypothetical protein
LILNLEEKNLAGQEKKIYSDKTLPTIWHTYVKLVTKYQISAINSCGEKCDEKYFGRTEIWLDRRKKYIPT